MIHSAKDLPREKMKAKGARSLSDLELLRALIGSGNAQRSSEEISQDVLKMLKKRGADIDLDDLLQIKGMGSAKTTEIVAAFEIARRYLLPPEALVIKSTEDAINQFGHIRTKQQEHFVLVTLDGGNRLINTRTLSTGTLTASLVHSREVFEPAIEDKAASIIVAHNHPSGNLEPSEADKQVTKQLQQAGDILGIKLLDHIIITKTAYRTVDA